uniref:C2H2-type domain-containing protein n=1 Tax=Panagrellus redivivus TaxID=6233 RepID=A0A7E4VXM0_PANRE
MSNVDASVIVDGRCKLCDVALPMAANRTPHLESESHIKKHSIWQFFTKELCNTKPDQASLLATRYLLAGVPVIGAEHIYELLIDEEKNERIWLCSICHVADWALATVDEHIHSREHVKNCLQNIKITDNKTHWDKVLEQVKTAPESDHSAIEHAEFLAAVRARPWDATTVPVAYLYPTEKEELIARLKLRDSEEVTRDLDSRRLVEEVTDLHNVEYCTICNESYFVHSDNSDATELRELHLSSLTHQTVALFKAHVQALAKTKTPGLPSFVTPKEGYGFTVNQIDETAYGAPVGLEHCVVFAPENDVLCLLCCCVVPEKETGAHFSSELHSERYLRSLSPSTVINIDHEPAEARRKKLTEEFSSRSWPEVNHWVVNGSLPKVFQKIAYPEKRNLLVKKTDIVNYKNSKVAICDVCNVSFLSSNISNYESHIFTDEHFEKLLAKQKIDRDERSFINEFSDLPMNPRKSKNPFWRDIGPITSVQNFGEYGMELIFKDVVSEKYICTCCYDTFDIEDKDVVVNHARSLQHIQAALSILNKDMAARLVFTRNETELKHLTLMYLQNYKAPIWEPKLRTFDPMTAYRLNRIVKIPRTLIRLTVMEPFSRDSYIRDNKLAGETGDIVIPDDDDCVCLTRALSLTNLLVIKVNPKNAVLWCMDCQLSFSLKLEDFKTVWIDHMLSDMHWERSVEISRNMLGRNYVKDEVSVYQPVPYDHSATPGKKKVSWVWNDDTHSFEFCINGKILHTDVLHRENFHGVSNLYCSLCCENLPLASQGVTSHVRSLKHIFFYMHKYFSKEVGKIESILTENASEIATARLILRDFVTDTLRVMPNAVGKVGLYDANPRDNIAPEVQEILASEARVNTHQMLLVRTLVKVSQLPTTAAPHSFHDLSTEVPKAVNPKSQVLLQLVLNNVVNNAKFPDTRPPELGPIITVPTPNPSMVRIEPAPKKETRPFIPPNGPVISKIKLGQNGVPTIQLAPTVAPVPPVGVPMPVPPPMVPVKLPVAAMDEPMDISDGEPEPVKQPPPRRHRRSRSRSRTPDRYGGSSIAAQYARDYGLDSPARRRSPIQRSRSPSAKKSRFSPARSPSASRKSRFSPNEEASRNVYRKYSRSRSPDFHHRRPRSPSPQQRHIPDEPPRRFTDKPSRFTDDFAARDAYSRQFAEPERRIRESSRSQSPNRRRFTENRRPSPTRYRSPSRSRSPIIPINGYGSPPRRSYNEYPNNGNDSRSRSPIDSKHEVLQAHRGRRSPSPLQRGRRTPSPMQRQYQEYSRNHGNSRSMSRSDSRHSLTMDVSNSSRPDSRHFMHEDPNGMHCLVPPQQPVIEMPKPAVHAPATFEELRRQQMIANLPKITPDTTILPTVDLTKPPPPIPGAPVVMPPVYGMPPPLNYGMPPPMISTYGGFPPAIPPPIVDIEAAKAKAKRDLYDRDLSKIETIPELVNYLEQQGQDPIPPTDPPLLFNDVVKKKKGLLGANLLAQVLCYDQPELETYLCTLCREWTTVSEIFNHLKSPTHRLNYLSKMYKAQYAKAIIHDDIATRDKVLNESAMKISALEGSKECNIRMRCILNVYQIGRIWPQYEQYVDNSWKIDDDDEFQQPPSKAPAPPQSSQDSRDRRTRESDRPSDAGSSSRRGDRDRERERERERDSHREKERGRERERDRDRHDRDRERRRSRSPRDSNSNRRSRRSRTPVDNRPIWEKQAEMMRSVIDAAALHPTADIDEIERRKEVKSRKPVKPETPGYGNGNGFEEEWNKQFNSNDFSNNSMEAPPEPKLTAAEKRKREQEAEKAKLKEAQKFISTLVLISQEAAGPQGVDKDIVDRICAENNVDPEEVFSEEVLDDAGKRVGGDMIVTFTAIAHHYKNPLQPPPRVLQERAAKNQPHAVSILQQIGLDKSAIAVLLRKVTKAKLGEEAPAATRFSSRAGMTPEEKRLRRGKRGGVKNRLKAMNSAARAANANFEPYPDEYSASAGYEDPYSEPGLPAGYYERFVQTTAKRPPAGHNRHPPPSRAPPGGGYYDYETNSHPYEEHRRHAEPPQAYGQRYDYPEYPASSRAPPPPSQSASARAQLASMPHASPPQTSSRSSMPYYADPEPTTDFRSMPRGAPPAGYGYGAPSKAPPQSAHGDYHHPSTSRQYPSKDPYNFDSYGANPSAAAQPPPTRIPVNNPASAPSRNWEDAAQELSNLFK